MAFANLFTRLSAVEEAVKSPAQPPFTHRDEPERGKRGRGQGEQTGPHKKRRCDQAQTTSAYNATSLKSDESRTTRFHMRNAHTQHAGVDEDVIHNHGDKAGYSNLCHKSQNYKTKNNRNVNKHQQQRRRNTEGQKIQHQQKDRGRPANRGGSHQSRATLRRGEWDSKNKNAKKDLEVKHTRFMTQEFKDQNAFLVDGRLLCRYFLWGRCIKGDDCQLEHVQGYNDLVKEVCKFYIQGFCTKGESCPYMHKSFPCKFFHRKGKCSHGADCRFSHDPLNDVTKQLLDEALKRENDLYELAKKAEEESSGQPANTEESEITDANRIPDTLIQPLILRPNFYKSTDTDAEKETLSCETEELADIMEAVSPHESDAAQPHSPPSTNLDHVEPVCYSVEAVLGPQLSKPFPSFVTTPGSQESAPLSSSDCTSDSAKQSEVPYSVDAVLRSRKSVENSAFGHTPTAPTAQTVSYTPKRYFEEITEALLSSETQTEKVLCSLNTRNEANKSQEKMFKSLLSPQVHTSLISKTCPNLTLASGDHKKHSGNMSKSLKPAQRGSYKVKLDLLNSPVAVAEKSASPSSKGDLKGGTPLPMDITCSVNCKNEDVLPFGHTKLKNIFSRPPGQTSTSKHPIHLKPHLSVLTSDSQASINPLCPSSGLTELKGRAAVPTETVSSSFKTSDSTNPVSRHFAAEPTEICLHSKKTQSGLKVGTQQHYSTENTADCSSKIAHCGDLAVGCKKTLKRSFHSLFASPITETLLPLEDSVSSSCPQGFIQSSCPAPQSAECRSNHLSTALEPDKASARTFLSLFAAPLRAAPLPCIDDYPRTSSCRQQSDQSVDNSSNLSDSRQRGSNLETSLPRQVTTDVKESLHVPRSPNFSPNPKIRTEDCSTEPLYQPTKQLLNPVCSPVSDSFNEMSNSPSTTHDHKQVVNVSPNKGSENSILKTLFLCLSPYQQDGEQQDATQISVPSECEKDRSSPGCVSVKQERKCKRKGRRKKKLKTEDSHTQSTEKTVEHSSEHQPSLQTPQISLKATGGSTLSSPEMTEPQMRNSGTPNLPVKPVVPLMQHHTQPRLKHTSEEGKCVSVNVAPTSLKDLFKTFDTTVFHFGH